MAAGTPSEKFERIRIAQRADLDEFGEYLRSRRQTLGLTQQQMADKVGVTQATISRLESGEETPKTNGTAQAIALFYDLPKEKRDDWFRLFTPLSNTGRGPLSLIRDQSAPLLVAALASSSPLWETSQEASPDWEKARQIIQGRQIIAKSSPKDLADRAAIPFETLLGFLRGESALEENNALKLYRAMHRDIAPLDRREFLKALGLLPLALATSHDFLLTANLPKLIATSTPYETGIYLLGVGREVARHSWEEAIPWLQQAEETLQASPVEAARAALLMAQIRLNLGDYDQAHLDVLRVQHLYPIVVDPELEAELYRIRGWLSYYEGDFSKSKRWLSKTIMVARKSGLPYLADHHFLARTYHALAERRRNSESAIVLYRQAEMEFEESRKNRPRWDTDAVRSYDFFRGAQLLRAQGKSTEAAKLRDKARQMLGADLGVAHIELEEARLAIADGETRLAGRAAEHTLSAWKQVTYAKGTADSLKVLGLVEATKGNTERALEIEIAAWCVFPFENKSSSQNQWIRISNLLSDAIGRERRKSPGVVFRDLRERAERQQGYFSCLKYVGADRTGETARILEKVESIQL